MFTARGIERVAAVLLLAVVVGVVIVVIIGPGPLETSREEIRATLLEIEADSGLFATSAAFLIFVNLITIPLAAALYIVFRSHGQPLALLARIHRRTGMDGVRTAEGVRELQAR